MNTYLYKLYTTILFVMFCSIAIPLKATNYKHTFTYSYDPAGNRYTRAYSVMEELRKASPSVKDSVVLDSLHAAAQTDADTIANNQSEFIKNSITEGELKVVYPNPTRGNVYLDFTTELENTRIEVTDLEGNALGEIRTSGAYLQIDLSLFPNGTYLLRITTQENKQYVRKIIKL